MPGVDSEGQLVLEHTPVFSRNLAAASATPWGQQQRWVVNAQGELVIPPKWRYIMHQGGTRSSKTYSLAQYFAWCLLTRPAGYSVTLVRQSLPALKLTALRDFEDVLKSMGINPDELHNKQEKKYTFPNGNYLEYLSVLSAADGQKIRGARRTDLWCSEANELNLEVWRQLNLRTEGQTFADFNPSDEYHWIWDVVQTRKDAIFLVSTYLDNPFLKRSVLNEILQYQQADPNYWKIYGLGERGISGSSIYSHWQQIDLYPAQGLETFGLDFGFNHPTALVGQKVISGRRYAQQYLYQSNLNTDALIQQLEYWVPKDAEIWADAAAPEKIRDIELAGWYNIKPANKAVLPGILELKSKPLIVAGASVDLVQELKSYKWRTTASGIVLDEPVKIKDDALDALRYAAYNSVLSDKNGQPITEYLSFKPRR